MAKNNLISDVIAESSNRRSLLKKLGVATAAAGAAMATGGIQLNAQSAMPSVVDVLQFALNLEYLESEFYTFATSGKTIDMAPYSLGIDGSGMPGATTGGSVTNFGNNIVFTQAIAMEIAQDERDHVALIRSALQSVNIMPVAKPAINLAALGSFATEGAFLTIARVLEDIGVTAYAGAAQLTTVSGSPYIGTAARILATEAEHVGNIRLQVARLALPSPTLDGVDFPPPPTGTQYISVNANGLVETRTPGQVLYLAYGGGSTGGGFFPNGVNGALNTSSAPATMVD